MRLKSNAIISQRFESARLNQVIAIFVMAIARDKRSVDPVESDDLGGDDRVIPRNLLLPEQVGACSSELGFSLITQACFSDYRGKPAKLHSGPVRQRQQRRRIAAASNRIVAWIGSTKALQRSRQPRAVPESARRGCHETFG
jgi:hypothetical protein